MDSGFDTSIIVNIVVGALVSVLCTLVLTKLRSIETKMDDLINRVQENKTTNAVQDEKILGLFQFKDRVLAKLWNGGIR